MKPQIETKPLGIRQRILAAGSQAEISLLLTELSGYKKASNETLTQARKAAAKRSAQLWAETKK